MTTQQHILDNIPQLGHISQIIANLEKSVEGKNKIVAKSTIKCINSISRNSFCCKTMIKNQNIIKLLILSYDVIPGLCEEISETLSLIFSHKLKEYVILVQNQQLLKELVQLLERKFESESKKVATSSRAYIVKAIQNIEQDEILVNRNDKNK